MDTSERRKEQNRLSQRRRRERLRSLTETTQPPALAQQATNAAKDDWGALNLNDVSLLDAGEQPWAFDDASTAVNDAFQDGAAALPVLENCGSPFPFRDIFELDPPIDCHASSSNGVGSSIVPEESGSESQRPDCAQAARGNMEGNVDGDTPISGTSFLVSGCGVVQHATMQLMLDKTKVLLEQVRQLYNASVCLDLAVKDDTVVRDIRTLRRKIEETYNVLG